MASRERNEKKKWPRWKRYTCVSSSVLSRPFLFSLVSRSVKYGKRGTYALLFVILRVVSGWKLVWWNKLWTKSPVSVTILFKYFFVCSKTTLFRPLPWFVKVYLAAPQWTSGRVFHKAPLMALPRGKYSRILAWFHLLDRQKTSQFLFRWVSTVESQVCNGLTLILNPGRKKRGWTFDNLKVKDDTNH